MTDINSHTESNEASTPCSDDAFLKKVQRSGWTTELYEETVSAFRAIAKQTTKKPLEESSSEKYHRIKREMDTSNQKKMTKKTKKEIKNDQQRIITSFFAGSSPIEELAKDDWVVKRSAPTRRNIRGTTLK